MGIVEIIKIVLQSMAVLISAGVLIWAKKKYQHFKATRETIRTAQNQMLGMVMEDLKAIKQEVQPNGGHSLNDKVSAISTHLVDIDKKLIELKVRQRNGSEILDVANWESDSDGRVEYVSTALCDLLGRSSSSLMDNKWTAYLHPEDKDRVVKEWNESVKSAGDFNSVYRFIKSDGGIQKVNGKAIHNTDEAGKVMNGLGRLIKIT